MRTCKNKGRNRNPKEGTGIRKRKIGTNYRKRTETATNKETELGRHSVGKVISLQAWGYDFQPWNPCKSWRDDSVVKRTHQAFKWTPDIILHYLSDDLQLIWMPKRGNWCSFLVSSGSTFLHNLPPIYIHIYTLKNSKLGKRKKSIICLHCIEIISFSGYLQCQYAFINAAKIWGSVLGYLLLWKDIMLAIEYLLNNTLENVLCLSFNYLIF